MPEIKLKECPCCGGEVKFELELNCSEKTIVKVICRKCRVSTRFATESVDYCAKEEVAEMWNRRSGEKE